MEQKIKESIAVFLTVATIAFIAGAENYYSETQYEFNLQQIYHNQEAPPTKNLEKRSVKVSTDSLRLVQRYTKK